MSELTPGMPPSADLRPPELQVEQTRRPRRRMNALAVFSFILALLLSPFAALFGHIAAGQVHRSQGAERGAILAWVSAGFGYLWLVGFIIGAVLIYQAYTA